MAKRKRHTNIIKQEPQGIKISASLVDVIIPVHQRFDLLAKCLNALPEAFGDISYRVIIIDNGSPKEQADNFYSDLPSNIKVIRNNENLGFPRACNKAFERGYSPLVFFLNDDVILHAGCMEKLVTALNDPKVGIVGMKLIFPDETDLPHDVNQRPAGKVQHVGLSTSIRAEIFHQFIGWSVDHPKVNAMRNVYGVTGAAMLTRHTLFSKAGKFYEGYGQGCYEDIDFCMSVRQLGYNILVVPEATGIHYTGATATTYNIAFPLNENRMIFMQRWQKFLDWSEVWCW